jgi:hypothetical protein
LKVNFKKPEGRITLELSALVDALHAAAAVSLKIQF